MLESLPPLSIIFILAILSTLGLTTHDNHAVIKVNSFKNDCCLPNISYDHMSRFFIWNFESVLSLETERRTEQYHTLSKALEEGVGKS